MKKIIALLTALVLCLSLAVNAFAAADVETIIVEWAELEAIAEDMGFSGEFYTVLDGALLFWIPDELELIDAPEDGNDYLGYFMNQDSSYGCFIAITEPNDGLDFDAYLNAMADTAEENNLSMLQIAVINGLATVAFTTCDENGEEAVDAVSIVLDDGSVMTFLFPAAVSTEYRQLTSIIAGSIQAAE